MLDVSGWDLGKALRLMAKGNAVVIKWLTSPISYGADVQARDRLMAFARQHADPAAVARHYLHLGLRQRAIHLADRDEIAIKKLFYVLRPAAELRWLRVHADDADDAVAPINWLRCWRKPTCRVP